MPAMLPASRRGVLALLVVAAPFVAACERATAPEPALTEFALRELFVDPRTLWDSTTSLIVSAAVVDTVTPLDRTKRVRMNVTTSGGDREQLGLARMMRSEDHRFYHLLGVGVRPNADFDAIRRSIEPFGARINLIPLSRLFASVFVFDPANVPRVAGTLARRRDIDIVEADGFATCGLAGCAPGPAFFAMLRGGLPFRARSNQPTPFDGFLEIQPGDTIRLAVTQPDGTTVRHEHVVPPWTPGGPSSVYAP
jgi:hypothetical protein